jgi:hypothetical protein
VLGKTKIKTIVGKDEAKFDDEVNEFREGRKIKWENYKPVVINTSTAHYVYHIVYINYEDEY